MDDDEEGDTPELPLVLLRPLDSGRNSFELFVLFLGVFVGWPLLFGAPIPGSTTELLGPVWARVWAWMLVGGCLIALTGVWWTWWAWLSRWIARVKPAVFTGLLIEQVGLVSVGVATVIWAVGVSAMAGSPGRIIPAGLVFGWGLACFWRAWQIRRWVRTAVRHHEDH